MRSMSSTALGSSGGRYVPWLCEPMSPRTTRWGSRGNPFAWAKAWLMRGSIIMSRFTELRSHWALVAAQSRVAVGRYGRRYYIQLFANDGHVDDARKEAGNGLVAMSNLSYNNAHANPLCLNVLRVLRPLERTLLGGPFRKLFSLGGPERPIGHRKFELTRELHRSDARIVADSNLELGGVLELQALGARERFERAQICASQHEVPPRWPWPPRPADLGARQR